MSEIAATVKNNQEYLFEFISTNFRKWNFGSSGGLSFDFPNFELMPFDYLEFAEQELNQTSLSSRIGCVSNLKRATECEMDTLIHILGLSSHVKSFPRKLDFVSKVGLISPRSLEKLNRIRNRMEHEYSVPDLGELEAYFDLASGFVHSIEGYIFMITWHAEQEWCWIDEQHIHGDLACRVNVQRDPPKIEFSVFDSKERKFSFGMEDFETYLLALKAVFLLCRATTLLSADYVAAKLTGTPLAISRGRR